ncbi:MAG: MFS transporter [Deltaproteobacteria bacterium]|nr:MFS transporter [Deltaproteobacteria bacterium]
MNTDHDQSRLFFGWWTVMVTGIVSGLGVGFYFYGISALLKPISLEIGLNLAATSGAAGVGIMIGSLIAPLAGMIVDRFGPRWTIISSLVVIALGLVLMGFIHSVWAFYLVWGLLLGLGVSFGMTIAVDKALTDWFVKKLGLAIGVKFAVMGLLNAATLPLVALSVTWLGWRMTCMAWAIIMVMSIPLIWVFVKDKRPEHYGLRPDGDLVVRNPGEPGVSTGGDRIPDSSCPDEEYSLKRVLRTRAYWILASVLFLNMYISSGFNIHCIPLLTETGIDPLIAGGMMGMMLFFTIPSRLVSGFFADFISVKRLNLMTILPFLFYLAGVLFFLLNPTTITTYILLILYGLGHGMPTALIVVIISRFFGRKAFGSIFGSCFVFTAPATLSAPIVTGWIFDVTHSYKFALLVFMVFSVLAMTLLFFLKAPNPKEYVIPQ